jgi:hypothetical protein
VIDPKTFMEYLEWGIANSFHLSGHEQYPLESIAQNDSTHGVL